MQNRKAGDENERDLPEMDGTRPDEEVGPTEAESAPTGCETSALPGDGAEDSEFQGSDEVHESFPIEPIRAFIDVDGLPNFAMPTPEQTEAIPFAYETVICVEDDRAYVEVFEEEVVARGWQHRRDGLGVPPGTDHLIEVELRSRFARDGVEHERRSYKPEDVHRLWDTDLIKMGESSWLPVRMRRERCKFYKRQVFSNDEVPNPEEFGHKIVFRNCSARRSNGGAFLSLRDEGIYSCDYRLPFDAPSVGVQDKIDAKKLRDRPHTIRLPLFGLPGDDVHLEDTTNERNTSRTEN